jgi:16S rRNA (guanine1207-N2)-methyltransferase
LTPNRIRANVHGFDLTLQTSPRVFSHRSVDRGTLAMLSVAEIRPDDKVLDLGCGYGVVGIVAAKLIGPSRITMVDIDEEAVELASLNCHLNGVAGVRVIRSDAFSAVDDTDYTLILSNPPYHEDFRVPKTFIEKGFNRLAVGGRMCMVTKRRTWYKNKMVTIFGGVRIVEVDGYYVFTSVKTGPDYAKRRG